MILNNLFFDIFNEISNSMIGNVTKPEIKLACKNNITFLKNE